MKHCRSIKDLDSKFQKAKKKPNLQDPAYIKFHNTILIQKFKLLSNSNPSSSTTDTHKDLAQVST